MVAAITEFSASTGNTDPMSTPKTFEAHGHTWTSHTPGDAMPCDGIDFVTVLFRNQKTDTKKAMLLCWLESDNGQFTHVEIIGWRYATPEQEESEFADAHEELKALKKKYQSVCSRLHASVEKHSLGLGGEHVDSLVCDELDRVKAENASLQRALKAIYDATDCYADGAPDASAHDKLALEISTLAKPFLPSLA
jgi:hypothetical protein